MMTIGFWIAQLEQARWERFMDRASIARKKA
jgi:hypothetical protein